MERKNVFFGMVLILFGCFMALTAFNIVPEFNFLFVIAGAFLVAYVVFQRNIGFLIPGCILAAVATFATLEQAYHIEGEYFLLLLGSAFVAVYLIHTVYQSGSWGERNWPLIPGGILIFIGAMVLSAKGNLFGVERQFINTIVPVLLIVLGLLVLFGGKRKSNKE